MINDKETKEFLSKEIDKESIKEIKDTINKVNKDPKLTLKQKRFVIEYIKNWGNWFQASKAVYNVWSKWGRTDIIEPTRGANNTIGSIAVENLQKPTIRKYLDNFGDKAGAKIIEHIDNEDANISLKASIFTYEQVHWKATQKTETNHKFMLTNWQNEPIEDLGNIVDTYAIETQNNTEETEIDTIDNY